MLSKLSALPQACQIAAFSLLVRCVALVFFFLKKTRIKPFFFGSQQHDYTIPRGDKTEETRHITLLQLCTALNGGSFPDLPPVCVTGVQQFFWAASAILTCVGKQVFLLSPVYDMLT